MLIRLLRQVKDGRLEFLYRCPPTTYTLKHWDDITRKRKKKEKKKRKSIETRHHRKNQIRALPHWNKKLTWQRCAELLLILTSDYARKVKFYRHCDTSICRRSHYQEKQFDLYFALFFSPRIVTIIIRIAKADIINSLSTQCVASLEQLQKI